MIVRFGLHLDAMKPARPGCAVGDVTVGPAGFVGILETQLGLPPVLARAGEASLAYRGCLQACDNESRFYHRSFAADPLNVARTLLEWRAAWYEAGWDGGFDGEAPRRLADMAAVEALAREQVPACRGQRLHRIAHALETAATQIERVELHDEPDALPHAWRAVLAHLDVVPAPGAALAPRAAPGTDLRRVQVRLLDAAARGEGEALVRETLAGDGSLVVVRSASRDLSAQAVAETLRAMPDRGAVVLVAERDGIILDNGLERVGLPRCGFQHRTRFRAITQVLKLHLAPLWEPLDPHRLLQLLIHPVGPLPRYARAALAAAVADSPGVGGRAWREALDAVAARQRERLGQDERAVAALRGDVAWWLECERYPALEGAPVERVVERAQACATWSAAQSRRDGDPAERALFAAAFAQCEALIDALERLREQGHARIVRVDLDTLVDEVTGQAPDPATFAQAGRPRATDRAATVTSPCETVVWWDLAGGTREAGYPWSRREVEALRGAGVALPEVAERLRIEGLEWLRPVTGATRRLVLVVHDAEAGHHPLWSRIEGLFDGFAEAHVEPALHGGAASIEGLGLATRALEVRPLPRPRRWWAVPEDCRLEARASESYSSLAKLVYHPHEWVLTYPADLAAGRAAELADGPRLYGSLAHALFEAFFEAHPGWQTLDDREVDAWTAKTLPRLVEECGAVLLEPGRGNDRQRVTATLERALRRLLDHLRAAGIREARAEVPVCAPFRDITLRGAVDLLLTDASGAEAVLDAKWGSGAYRAAELAGNRHLQLAVYAYLRKAETGAAEWPRQAYFIIGAGALLSQDAALFPDADVHAPDDAAGVAALWPALEASYAWRREQLGAGRVEVIAGGAGPDEDSPPPEGALPVPDEADRFDDFANLTGWEETR